MYSLEIVDGNVYFETETVTYCDIYKCSECPRYGDDCDGKCEEEDDDEAE
nr:hypothetical protein [Clostridia bacterium]